MNTYGYSFQNPVNYFDPDGRLVWFGIPAYVWITGGAGAGIGVWWGLNNPSAPDFSAPYYNEDGSSEDGGSSCPTLPDDLVGNNPRKSSGSRTNTDLPGSKFPDVVDDLTGGNLKPKPGGGFTAPNGVNVRPGKPGEGPRIDIPANGPKPPETIHFPPETPWPY